MIDVRAVWRRLPESLRYRIAHWRRVTKQRALFILEPLRFGTMGGTQPHSRHYGLDRGTPIDRFYIDRFIESCAPDIQGDVLEIESSYYTLRYGGDRVVTSQVLDIDPANPRATIIADLTVAEDLPSDSFDCVICPQTLLLIYEVRAAIATLHRLLRPGGVLLVTVPGISYICREDMDRAGDYWRFTSRSLARLLAESFGEAQVTVEARGNVYAATAFLQGLAVEEVRRSKLSRDDCDYELSLGARAVKRSDHGSERAG